MTEFVFAGPPQYTSCDPLVVEFADALKARPGEWAIYPRQDEATPPIYRLKPGYRRTLASRINKQRTCRVNGCPVPFRGGFEASARGGVLKVRYVGKKQ